MGDTLIIPKGTRPYRRYDWPTIKMVYVEGRVTDDGERQFPTLNTVAELFEANPTRVREVAGRERWGDQRKQYQANLERVRQEKRTNELAKAAADIDRLALGHATNGLKLIGVRLGEIAQMVAAQQRAKADQGSDILDFLAPAVDANEMRTLATAAREWHELAQRALGEIPAARLEISGPDRSPIRTDVRGELATDDPYRLQRFLEAALNVGLLDERNSGGLERGALVEASARDADPPVDPSTA